jgi:RNA polymerase sigma-70 factor (ECF subfamily)
MDALSDLSDEELLRLSAEGDVDAYGTLVHRLWLPAMGFCLKRCSDADDAQDIVQEAFIKLYLRRVQYRACRRVKALLFRILENLCTDYGRRRNSYQRAIRKVAEGLVASLQSRDEWAPHSLDLAEQLEALNSLTGTQRTVYLLRELEGLSYREISEVTGFSMQKVRVALHRARSKVAQSVHVREG